MFNATGSLSPTHIMDDHNGDKQQQIQDEVLLLAATAEQGSDHPLSRAILDAARNKNMHLPPLKEDATVLHVGSGVRCETDVGVVLVGNRLLMEAQGVREFFSNFPQPLCLNLTFSFSLENSDCCGPSDRRSTVGFGDSRENSNVGCSGW